MEIRNFCIMLSIIVLLIILKVFGTYFWLSTPGFYLVPGSPEYNCIELTDWIPFIVINIIFYSLVYQMKNYHYFEYNRLKKSIWTFYTVEVSLIFAITTCDELLTGGFQIEQIFEYMLINVGIFPL